MAHLIFPEGISSEKSLLTAVNTKHIADGANSAIEVYIKENGIDLTQASLDAETAENLDNARSLLHRQSINNTQLRDLQIIPVFSRLKGMIQYLKSINPTNSKDLGNWGIMVEAPNKVVYPVGFDNVTKTAIVFYTKHKSYAVGKSPLLAYLSQNKIDIAADEAAVDSAITFNDLANTSALQSENITEQRNLLWLPIVAHLKGIGNYLMKYYGKNQKGCGDYGYVVDSSVAKPKLVHSTIKLLDKATLKGLVIGGSITNNGTEDIHIYKGKTTTGNPIIIKPGQIYGVAKGFSTMTISNPSTLLSAKISALRIGR